MNDRGTDALGELRAAFASVLGASEGTEPIALGWATVELDRVERAFATAYPGAVTSTVELGVDHLLGAHVRLLQPGIAGLPPLVLLEPSTEGRLAATLARHGEGPAAIWIRPAPGEGRADPGTVRSSIATPGPFGSEVLLLDGPIHGPHRLVVLAEPGTITA